MIERFAALNGFQKDSDSRFYKSDGSWIGKTAGNRFQWEQRSESGDLVRFYWPEEHCLEREPLELDIDVWWAVEQQPDQYALILLNVKGAPVEITGDRLAAMRDEGRISINPATIRIAFDSDQTD